MVQYQNAEAVERNWDSDMGRAMPYTMDWNNEVTPDQAGSMSNGGRQNNDTMINQSSQMGGTAANRNNMMAGMRPGTPMGMQNGNRMGMAARPQLNMQNTVSDEVIQSPLTVSEAYLGSLKATLARNKGNYIVATFLIGTQNTVSFEGILYEVGNDFVTIYQEGRDRYIVVDMYSLKYMEFYDTRRREMCEAMLEENGMWRTL